MIVPRFRRNLMQDVNQVILNGMDDRFQMGTPTNTPALDMAVLESLFALGDSALRKELSAQLRTDFERLHAALATDDGYRIGRAAHELKGLAATVGAARLAQLAQAVDPIAEGLASAALAVVAKPLRTEIELVLEQLRRAAGPSSE